MRPKKLFRRKRSEINLDNPEQKLRAEQKSVTLQNCLSSAFSFNITQSLTQLTTTINSLETSVG